MRTLFIDSSRKSLSVALANDDKLIFISNIDSHSKHSNYLLSEIKNILTKSNISINDIDNYVVLIGPGSFTGIRVGVTVAKTLAWTLSKKIYTLNNLEALKLHANNDIVISVIPDKKDNSYVGIYSDSIVEDYINITSEKFNISNRSISIVTMGENEFAKTLYEKLNVNNNIDLKVINDYDYIKLIKYALSKNAVNVHGVKPIYLKKIDAEKKK